MDSETTTEETPRKQLKPWTSQAGPIQTKKVTKVLDEIGRQHQCFKELTGVGVSEHSYCFWSPFGGGYRDDVAAAQEAIWEEYGGVITRDNYQTIIKSAGGFLDKLVRNTPVKDNRITKEADEASKAESKAAQQQREAEHKAKRAAFIGMYGQEREIEVPDGHLGVILVLTYDGSDGMSDYFAPHCAIDSVILGHTEARARTEAVLRGMLARYPSLLDIEFEWHKENYSGGHGNYLRQKESWDIGIAFAERPGFMPKDVRMVRWEVQFCPFHRTYNAYRDYTDRPAVSPAGSGKTSDVGSKALVKLNTALGGVELWFPGKPDSSTIFRLKNNGWRPSKVGGWHWYKKDSEYARKLANEIAGVSVPAQEVPPAGAMVQAQEDAYVDNEAQRTGAGVDDVDDFNSVCSRHHY